jgi:hypothetical protein
MGHKPLRGELEMQGEMQGEIKLYDENGELILIAAPDPEMGYVLMDVSEALTDKVRISRGVYEVIFYANKSNYRSSW